MQHLHQTSLVPGELIILNVVYYGYTIIYNVQNNTRY